MKISTCTFLALASILHLSACSGQSPLNSAYPANAVQQNASLNQPGYPNQQSPLNSNTGSFTQVTQQQSSAMASQPSSAGTLPEVRANANPKTSAHSVNSVKPTASKPAPALKSNAVAPAPLPAKTVTQASAAQDLLAKAVERFKSLQSFKINVEGFETLSGKSPSRLSFNMLALNGQAKIEVLKHSNSMYVGVKMAYQFGTNAISVRPGGLLGFVKVDTKMSDERLATPRGYRLDQIDAFAISKRLLNGPHQPKVLGKTQIDGRNVAILEYTQANDFDPRITRELLAVDMEDSFIRMHEMYEGSTLVFSLKLSNIQLNAPVSVADLAI